jgi:hypothetical protein
LAGALWSHSYLEDLVHPLVHSCDPPSLSPDGAELGCQSAFFGSRLWARCLTRLGGSPRSPLQLRPRRPGHRPVGRGVGRGLHQELRMQHYCRAALARVQSEDQCPDHTDPRTTPITTTEKKFHCREGRALNAACSCPLLQDMRAAIDRHPNHTVTYECANFMEKPWASAEAADHVCNIWSVSDDVYVHHVLLPRLHLSFHCARWQRNISVAGRCAHTRVHPYEIAFASSS